jgi:hypothetical protein
MGFGFLAQFWHNCTKNGQSAEGAVRRTGLESEEHFRSGRSAAW